MTSEVIENADESSFGEGQEKFVRIVPVGQVLPQPRFATVVAWWAQAVADKIIRCWL
jgi:hypothetical protein